METRDILTMTGWIVSCLLSILAGGYIVPKLIRKRKILSWATVSETALIPSDLRQILGVPITIEVGGVSPKSLTLVSLRIGNSGNEVIEKVSAAITINEQAKFLYLKPSENLGEFQKHVTSLIGEDKAKASLTLDYLNPGVAIDFDLLLSDYEGGSLILDSAGPGLELHRREVSTWNISTSVLKSVGLSIVGVRYDPAAAAMSEIATELKAIRRYLQQK